MSSLLTWYICVISLDERSQSFLDLFFSSVWLSGIFKVEHVWHCHSNLLPSRHYKTLKALRFFWTYNINYRYVYQALKLLIITRNIAIFACKVHSVSNKTEIVYFWLFLSNEIQAHTYLKWVETISTWSWWITKDTLSLNSWGELFCLINRVR